MEKMNHKMLIEFVKIEETEFGAVPISENIKLINNLGEIAKNAGYDSYVKGYPKEKTNYVPSNKSIEIKTVEDIAKLSAEQFEFFIDDLRNFCNLRREMDSVNKIIPGLVSSQEGMTWLDTGLNESKVNLELTNKI